MEPKERILLKANELFNRYGLRSVSMDDIATQLGMSKKTLYQYYTDKDELVQAVFDQVLQQNRECCLQDKKQAENAIHEVFIAFDRVMEMFSNMSPAVLYDMEKYHPGMYAKFNEFKSGFLFNMISSNIERGKKEEVYRSEVDTEVITRYRVYTLMMAFNSDVFPTNRTQLLHIEQQLQEHFLYGLATSKGQKLIQKYKNQRAKK